MPFCISLLSTGQRQSKRSWSTSIFGIREITTRPPKTTRIFPNSSTTIRTLKSRNKTIGTESLPASKKTKSGIGAELRSETGRFPCFQGCFRIFRTIFKLSAIFPHFISASTIPRPPAPSLRRNMLRRREGAGGRGAFEKPVVFFLTKKQGL